MQNDIILKINNLNINLNLNQKTLLININFYLKKNKILGIVGESGSGKSITCLAILNLINKKLLNISGSIEYFEDDSSIDLLKLSNKQLRNIRGKSISMIFQEPMTSLNPSMKCGKQVAEIIKTHFKLSYRSSKTKVLNLFKEVQLPNPERIYNSFPHEISGGQKQRVMIAMAIACEPKILIADEPTTALDVIVQKEILDLLIKIKKKLGMSIIFITHDLSVVKKIADEIIVMKDGQIVEQNSVKNIFEYPQELYTKSLLHCRPPIHERYLELLTIDKLVNEPHFDNNIKVVSAKDREVAHQKIYNQNPFLKIIKLNKLFNIKSNLIFKKSQYFKALSDINFEVYEGETLGIVGESGCGKTTLGRTILQLIKPSSGEVIFENIKISELNSRRLKKFRKDIQIIFQDPFSSLNPKITIGEAILEPMRVFKMYNNEIDRISKTIYLLNRVGINEDSFYRYPHEFSGGQRQRICIARSLALNPKIIICDESVSALDVSVQAQVLNLLNELKREFNFTYIFISHDLSVVKYMSDRIIVLKDGIIEEINEADKLFNYPKSKYTKQLLDAIP